MKLFTTDIQQIRGTNHAVISTNVDEAGNIRSDYWRQIWRYDLSLHIESIEFMDAMIAILIEAGYTEHLTDNTIEITHNKEIYFR